MIHHRSGWLGVAAGVAGMFSTAAWAQSAAPIGIWQGQTSGDILQVNQDTSCSVSGTANAAGNCSWSSTSTGGVLTMMYPWVTEPGYIYWSVRWLDAGTILLNEVEVFVRVQ